MLALHRSHFLPRWLHLQVLTALELARQARIAANRAYLAGLGLGAGAMKSGQVPPLAPTDPVILAAARELASRAAEEQGRRQVRVKWSEWGAWKSMPAS